jgi:HSP20 family protein
MQRMSEDMDRIFGRFFGDWPLGKSLFGETSWPRIEAFRRGNKFVIRADVPGMNKDDIRVEVMNDELTISGERRSESEQTEGDYYAKEVSYGSFRRTVTLPPGANSDTASASFDKGVLEIEMDVPAEQSSRGRRIEVREPWSH